MYLKKYNNFNQEKVIGEYTIHLPDPPNLSKIENYGIVQHKQKWVRPDIPKRFETLPKADQNAIAKREWERRINGYWFLNNGNLEYLTGTNYLYLGHWWLDGLYPHFVDSDRDFFYVWDDAENDPNSTGLIYIADRREGKTYKATCILYNGISMEEESVGTIQSKTDKDAGIVFAKMINSWRRLPPFFKPTDEGLSLPKSALRFFEPSRKNTKDKTKYYDPALDSYIDYLPAVEVAADGLKVYRYIGDEVGKTTRINVFDRNKVVKECLMNGAKIVGKELLTSTVEEMEAGGGRACKDIWDGSDPSKKDPLGRTQTGLKRYFKPADYGLKGEHPVTGESFIDPYGYSKRELMREYLMAKRSVLEGEDLKSEMRKYPLTISEAFQSTNDTCVFDSEILFNRREELLNRPKTRRVNFYRCVETGLVKWMDAPNNGRWSISWDFDNDGESNKIITVKGVKKPNNTVDFVAGADPFAHTIVTGKGSMAAAYVIRNYTDRDPENSGKAICRYYARQPLKSLMNYDLMLMCEYYGCKINIENNYDDFVEDFEADGMQYYLMERPKVTLSPNARKQKKTFGTPSKDGFTNARHLRALVENVVNHGHKIDFVELIDDMLLYDPLDRTPFDDTVSYGMALLGVLEYLTNKKEDKPEKPRKFLKTFKIMQAA
jgi:hypothetical protein